MKKYLKSLVFVSIFIAAPLVVHAAVSDYLILQNIGSYKFITQTKNPLTKKIVQIPGYTTRNAPGMLAATDHFDLDHDDTTYGTDYESDAANLGVEVQVTKHAGGDSDRWLLHEVEDSYRSDDPARLGLLSQGTIIKKMGNDKFFSIRLGGGAYMWVSNNVVVSINYRSLQGATPEPIEVIQAYLQKFPSTVSGTLVLDTAHDVQWIKDEMDRRLWLCDKWFYQLQLGKVQQNQVYQESVKSMNVFLDYREKYYGIKAADEKNLLASYLSTNNGTGIKAKLTEYKNWWTLNKNKAISL